MRYTIEWNDGDVEIYETKYEQVARINVLEGQGYEMGTDFTISVMFAD